MRPWWVHAGILVILMVLGGVVYFHEATAPPRHGGLLSKYFATQIYWSAFALYTAISSGIVLVVFVLLKISRKRFTWITVILCHVLPVAILITGLKLGIHDVIEDLLKKSKETIHQSGAPPASRVEKKEHQAPHATPMKKFRLQEGGKAVEPVKQQ
jgi:hypothetical protein